MSWAEVAKKMKADQETGAVEEDKPEWVKKAARAVGIRASRLWEFLKQFKPEGPGDASMIVKQALINGDLPWSKRTGRKLAEVLRQIAKERLEEEKITVDKDEVIETAHAYPPSLLALLTPVKGSVTIIAGRSGSGKSLFSAIVQELAETPSDCRHQILPTTQSPFSAMSTVIIKYGKDSGMVFREDDVHANSDGGPAAVWVLVEAVVLKEGGAIGSLQWGMRPEAIERLKNGSAIATYQVDGSTQSVITERSVNRALVLPHYGVPAHSDFRALFTELKHEILPMFRELDVKQLKRGIRPTDGIVEVTKLALRSSQCNGFNGTPTKEPEIQPRWVAAKTVATGGVPIDPECIRNTPKEEKEGLEAVIKEITRRVASEAQQAGELTPGILRELRDTLIVTGELWFVGRWMFEETSEAAETVLKRAEEIGIAESTPVEMLKEIQKC